MSKAFIFGVGGGSGDGSLAEVSTAEEMDDILANATADDYGKVYKYTGESTSEYTKNSYYLLEE